MLNHLTREISNKRFLVYVALLYVPALSAGSWVPASSPIFDSAIYIKLTLVPLAQAFLMKGARYRWPDGYRIIVAASSAFYAGIILSTIFPVFF